MLNGKNKTDETWWLYTFMHATYKLQYHIPKIKLYASSAETHWYSSCTLPWCFTFI